jgi:hypothetical protein
VSRSRFFRRHRVGVTLAAMFGGNDNAKDVLSSSHPREGTGNIGEEANYRDANAQLGQRAAL